MASKSRGAHQRLAGRCEDACNGTRMAQQQGGRGTGGWPAARSPARTAARDSRTGGSPKGLQAEARPGTGEGLAPRRGEPAYPSAGNWAAPSIVAVGGASPKERGAGESVSQELGRRPRSSPSFGDGGGDEIDEAGSCRAVMFFLFSLRYR